MSTRKNFTLLIVALFTLAACTAKSPTETVTVTDGGALETEVSSTPAADECLNCHTDKQRLIDTAKLEVTLESESKGVG